MKKWWHKFNQREHKYINGAKGIISLFLCVMLVPMLTIASALIEFSRYQGTVTVARELSDMATLTTLAEYDPFLQERFGLLALSQDADIQKTYNDAYAQGAGLLGNSIDADSINATISGASPICDPAVLKQQILDYGEMTVLSEVLLEDLNIQKLIDEIKKLTQITALLDVMKATGDFTKSINALVEEGNNLVGYIEQIKANAETIVTEVENFCTSVYNLYEKIATSGGIPNFTDEEAAKEFIASYAADIEAIYNTAALISSAYSNLSSAITSAYTSVTDTFPTKLKDAKDKLAALKEATGKLSSDKEGGNSENKAQEESNSTVQLGDQILADIEEAFNDAAEELKGTLVSEVKAFADNIVSNFKENLGIPASWSEDYFTWPVSDAMLADIQTLLSHIPDIWDEENSETTVWEDLQAILLPSGFDGEDFMADIYTAFEQAIKTATDTFVSSVKDSIFEIISNLVTAIKEMFNLEVFYDTDLTAYVNLPDTDSPWADLLNAINSLLDAIDSFTNPDDIFDWLSGFTKLYDAVTSCVESIVTLAEKTIEQIGTFIGYLQHPEELYKMLILSGYMTHNLSNRTTVTTGDNAETSLTGYDYSSVLIPNASSPEAIGAGISGLAGYLSGNGSTGDSEEFDEMFMGAELEYILAGTNSEIMNQVVVFMQMYMFRLLATVPALFADTSVHSMAASSTIAAPVVYILVLLGDAFVDTVLLVNGNDIPFVKTGCFLSPNGIDDLIDQMKNLATKNLTTEVLVGELEKMQTNTSGSKDSGDSKNPLDIKDLLSIDYETHALILMMITLNDDDLTQRFANIVDLEASYYYKNNGDKSFDINKAYTALNVKNEMKFNSFIDLFSFSEDSVLKGKFEYVRGY